MPIGVEAPGTTITLDAASVGVIVDFKLPADVVKKFSVTGLGHTREQMKKSVMSNAQVFEFTRRLDPETQPVSKGDSGEWVVTLPKQTSGSAAGKKFTFDGFVEEEGEISGSESSQEGLTQPFKVHCTSEIVPALEA